MNKKVNIYVLIDPITCKVRYIGITTQAILRRYHKHIEESLYSKKVTHKLNWIRSLTSKGRLPIVKKLTETDNWQTALRIERTLIEKYKNSRNLTNNEDYIEGAFKRTISDSQKQEASLRAKSFYKNGGKPSNRKEISCFDLDGKFIRTFESMSEASRILNLSLKHVSLVVSGKKPQLKGYIFTRITDDAPKSINFDPNWGKKKKIQVLNLESGLSKIYSSQTELANDLGVTSEMINYYLKHPKALVKKKIKII